MYPGIKRYLFNCDIDLISTEDNLQEDKKKEKTWLFCDICVVLFLFLKPPYRLKVLINIFDSQILWNGSLIQTAIYKKAFFISPPDLIQKNVKIKNMTVLAFNN